MLARRQRVSRTIYQTKQHTNYETKNQSLDTDGVLRLSCAYFTTHADFFLVRLIWGMGDSVPMLPADVLFLCGSRDI